MSPAAAAALLLPWLWAPASASSVDLHEGRWDARLHRFEGDARVRLTGAQEWLEPKAGMPLAPGDAVRVGERGFAEVSLGASAIVRVEPGSEFVLEDLDPSRTRLRLNRGTILQKLKSLLQLERLLGRSVSYQVVTNDTVAAVRGTEFGVQISSVGTVVGVFDEGEVRLGEGPGALALGPEQEAAQAAGAPPSPVRPLSALRVYRARARALAKTLATIQRRYRALPIQKRRELRERLKKP